MRLALKEMLEVVLIVALFGAIFAPVIVFEGNAHSTGKTEYQQTKVGWLDRDVLAGEERLVTIRDRVTGRVTGTSRGIGPSARLDTFFVKALPQDLEKDRRYEIHLQCTKIGSLPDPFTHNVCEITSLREQ